MSGSRRGLPVRDVGRFSILVGDAYEALEQGIQQSLLEHRLRRDPRVR